MAERDPLEMPPERDEVSHFYRQLPREEPPASLDASIRNEAHRLGATRPAPLVPPTGRRSWLFPFAAAAVIVLAVAVTWHVEREQGDPTSTTTTAAPSAPPEIAAQAPRKEEPREMERRADVQANAAKKTAPTEAPPPASAPAPAAEAPRDRAERRVQTFGAAESPERWLERIAELRKDGKHDEADKQLAEFRKRYPGFRISGEILDKVEKK
jgi:type IV secretory pathway VirB10-like protein